MIYSVAWTPAAEADLRRLDARVAERIAAKIEWLSENADTARIETLTGRWRGVCKLRVGNYRVPALAIPRHAGLWFMSSGTVGESTGWAERIDRTAFYGRLRACHEPLIRTSETSFETVIAATQC
ncbi:MAG: type II toxin-antitoxin system RelE/ParE family toxin [Bryobacterales bacterium]|nr:type II toxin-antitoxin system RelE/ParE family toxin [Bryobacterales bacterium]